MCLKILIIEDDLNLKNAIFRACRILPIETKAHWASTFEEASMMIRDEKFDLFLTDYQLPNLYTGFDVIDYIQERKITAPILMTSGKSFNEIEKSEERTLEGIPFLKKPFSLEQFQEFLVSHKERSRYREVK